MLRTLVAALVVEVVMVVVLFGAKLPGPALLSWYRELGASAFAMDVLSVYVCVNAARLVAPSPYVPVAVLGIQLAHDLTFGYVLSLVPRGTMKVLDMFKDYARPSILAYDAVIVLSAFAVDVALTHVPRSVHALLGAVAAYVSLLVLHSF